MHVLSLRKLRILSFIIDMAFCDINSTIVDSALHYIMRYELSIRRDEFGSVVFFIKGTGAVTLPSVEIIPQSCATTGDQGKTDH